MSVRGSFIPNRGNLSIPSRMEMVVFAISAMSILGISWFALWPKWWRGGFLGEWLTYTTVAFVIFTWRPFRAALKGSRWLQRIAGLMILVGLVLGQFIGGGSHVFPLVRFQMFTGTGSSEIRVFHFIGVREGGQAVAIDPAQYYPSLDRGRFGSGNRRLLSSAIEKGDTSKSGWTYDRWLLAIMKRYNTSGEQLKELRVYGVDTLLELPRQEIPVRVHQIWSVDR